MKISSMLTRVTGLNRKRLIAVLAAMAVILAAAGVVLALVLATGGGEKLGLRFGPGSGQQGQGRAGAIVVIATISPIADIVRQVGGERVAVHNLLPAGASPHTFEPRASDVRRIAEADLIVTVGAGLDAWVDRLLTAAQVAPAKAAGTAAGAVAGTAARTAVGTSAGAAAGTRTETAAGTRTATGARVVRLELATVTTLLPAPTLDAGETGDASGGAIDARAENNSPAQGRNDNPAQGNGEGHSDGQAQGHDDAHNDGQDQDQDQGHDHVHEHGLYDPHFWLDPIRVREEIAPAIASALERIEESRGQARGADDYYQERLRRYQQVLTELDREIATTLAPARGLRFIAFHSAWRYFAARYGLVEVAAIEPFPGREPSPAWLAHLQEVAREQQARVIVAETQFNPQVARLLAEAVHGQLVTLDPEGGGALAGRSSYVELMRWNARRLAEAAARLQPAPSRK